MSAECLKPERRQNGGKCLRLGGYYQVESAKPRIQITEYLPPSLAEKLSTAYLVPWRTSARRQNVSSNDFFPAVDWRLLERRAELLRAVRGFFAARRFLEVETPLLSADVVVDRHLDPLSVILPDDPRRPRTGRTMWLQTSPEFAMKRLMAAGGTAIFQITRAFRAHEQGRLHNPEFTIVEWYRRDDDLRSGMNLLSELADSLLPFGLPEQTTYAAAFERWAQVDPHRSSLDELRAAARRLDVSIPAGMSENDRDAWLDLLLAERVEPNLGQERPVILYDYPPSQAALARVREENPPLAERFELYARGVELANGYHELLDPRTLRQRNATANRLRAADGKETLPEESRLLAAMEHGLPPCAGVALGFDRVVMLAVGAKSVGEAIAFPIDRA